QHSHRGIDRGSSFGAGPDCYFGSQHFADNVWLFVSVPHYLLFFTEYRCLHQFIPTATAQNLIRSHRAQGVSTLIGSVLSKLSMFLLKVKKVRILGLPFVLVAALASVFSCAAQISRVAGAVQGSVVDQTGGAVAGATVMVRNLSTGQTRTIPTNAEGAFYA